MAVVYTRLGAGPPASWRPRLPPAYAERLQRMRSADARARTLTGLWLLQLGARLAGLGEARLASLGRDAHGRPMLEEGPAFSVSHCGGLVACALSRETVPGLDVERIRPIDSARFGRYLSTEERSAAARDPAAFFAAWTAREATVKASGRVGLARIARTRVEGNRATVDGETLFLRRLDLTPGYMVCLASGSPDAAVWTQACPERDRKYSPT